MKREIELKCTEIDGVVYYIAQDANRYFSNIVANNSFLELEIDNLKSEVDRLTTQLAESKISLAASERRRGIAEGCVDSLLKNGENYLRSRRVIGKELDWDYFEELESSIEEAREAKTKRGKDD